MLIPKSKRYGHISVGFSVLIKCISNFFFIFRFISREATVSGSPRTIPVPSSPEITIPNVPNNSEVKVVVKTMCSGDMNHEIEKTETVCVPSAPTIGDLTISNTKKFGENTFIFKPSVFTLIFIFSLFRLTFACQSLTKELFATISKETI